MVTYENASLSGLIGRAARTGRTVWAPDVSKETDYIAAEPGTRSELALPWLDADGQVRFVVNVEHDLPNAYSATEIRWLEAFVRAFPFTDVTAATAPQISGPGVTDPNRDASGAVSAGAAANADSGAARSQEAAPSAVAPPAESTYDESVHFTVDSPGRLTPGDWQPMLAFAHLVERRPDAPDDEPHPTAVVETQAAARLGDLSAYREATAGVLQAVPRHGELTLVPSVPGAEFNPEVHTVRWHESPQVVEFRVRALADNADWILRGRLTVSLGPIVLGEIALSFAADPTDSEEEPDSSAVPAYRRIFACYSRNDEAIVRQFQGYATAIGDRYLEKLRPISGAAKIGRKASNA